MMRRRHRFAPVVALATGACFASRGDIRLLQQDLSVARAEAARNDSLLRVQIDRTLGAVNSMSPVFDSLRAVGARVARLQSDVAKFQGDVKGDLYGMNQQLLQIQQLTGQSQQRLADLRAQMEERNQQLATPPAGFADSVKAPLPGPAQLYQAGMDQLRRGSTSAARTAFRDLLAQYPTSDLAPDAQFQIGETYAAERNQASADSAYQRVVSLYPDAAKAPTALYKMALNLLNAGKTRAGRDALDDVIRKYPRSDEAGLARDRLKTLK